MRRCEGGLWAALGLLALLAGCGGKKPPETTNQTQTSGGGVSATPPSATNGGATSGNPHLALGNPSGATADASNANNYLLEHPQFALSFNNENGTPNWVSWRLSGKDLGYAERSNNFQPDPTLPNEFVHVTPRDYTGSGYDRGHLCPSADRSSSPEENTVTFYTTNIVPQAPGNNQGPWKQLEDYLRDQARQGGEIYTVAGPGGGKKRIGRGKVLVPQFTWKVAVVVPEGGGGAAQINERARVIAVRMPNISTIRNKPWRQFRTTVRAIEQETGLNLLSNLPQPVQDALEQREDTE